VTAPSPSGIAVAVATLERPDFLARCLDAVLSGHMVPSELVVVDQGGDPRTQAVVAERQRDVPITYVHQRRRGLSASRNAALAAVRSDVLVTTDDDCVAAPGWLATIARVFAETPTPQSVTGRVLPLGANRPGFYAVSSRTSNVRALLRNGAPPWTAGTGANVAVARRWAEQIGGWDERLGAGSAGGAGEDVDFVYRLLRAGGFVVYEPDAVVYHELQSAERRRVTRLSYGRGVGASCGLILRRGDLGATRMLAQWAFLRARLTARALGDREWRRLREELLVARGTLGGLAYGLRTGG
jgi:GT2 family glycosyltransferase